jgi:predicted HD phosphohydrolase
VQAKRYLVARDTAYRDALSDRSAVTLALQGDAMDDVEARAFEASSDAGALVALRRADERAKVEGKVVAPLSSWRSLCLQVSIA